MTESKRLLERVALRQRIVVFGRRFYLSFLVLAAIYAIVLLVSRLTGKIPDRFEPLSLLAIPGGALLLGLLLNRRPAEPEVARLVDQRSGTKDLYLTVALLDQAPGDYAPLVARDAESKASSIQPVAVVPFHWQRRLVNSAVLLGVLMAAIFWLPQFDPFGVVQTAQAEEVRKQELKESRKATKMRTALLKKKDNGQNEESEEVKKAIEGLKGAFKKSKREDKAGNAKRLAGQQKSLGNKWRKRADEKLQKLLSKASDMDQRFGGVNKAKLAKWTRELQEGSTESLQKEIDELKEELKQLAKTNDPAKKAALREKIKQRLKDLEELAKNKLDSKPLAAALKRAMKQLESSKRKGLSTESLEALSESLDLTKLELKQIAQSAKDLQELEKALQAIQMAKKLNSKSELDGEDCEACQSLDDYAELYAEMLGEEGEGTGGEGGGGGAPVEEGEETDDKFVNEKSKAKLVAGKVLLTLKDKGLSDRGEAKKEYRDAIQQVKQGASEAILKEDIPPGYLESIKTYFDTIKDGEDEN